jgi:hypothetical protein
MIHRDPIDGPAAPLRADTVASDDPLTRHIIGCGVEVHRQSGPGLLEGTYEEALCLELLDQGLSYQEREGLPQCLCASVCREEAEERLV